MVITGDEALQHKVKVLSLHGMTADAWSRFVGGPTGYEVVEAGFKYNMTDVAAALALPQLEAVEQHWKRRELVWQMYNERLERSASSIAGRAGGEFAARLPPLHAIAASGRYLRPA